MPIPHTLRAPARRRAPRTRLAGLLAAAILPMAAITALPTPAAADTVGTVTCPSIALGAVPALGLDILSATCGPATTSAGNAPGWALMTVTMTSTAVFTGDTSLAGTAANPQKLSADILLPPGYTPTRPAGYDSLYLLHGGGGTYQDWVRQSATAVDLPGATSLPSSSTKTGMLDVIGRSVNPYQGVIVMPEAGISGLYTDWKGTTDGGFAPKWETYHLNELLPWIDAHFDTVSNRSARAVAGFSLGGFGALKYAADRPDLFGAVGAFSPGTDLTSTVTPTPGNTQAPSGTPPTNTEVGIIDNAMWQSGAAIGPLFPAYDPFSLTPEATNGKFRVNYYSNPLQISQDPVAQLTYRLKTLFDTGTVTTNNGSNSGTPAENSFGGTVPAAGTVSYDWPQADPVDLAAAGGYAAYSGRIGIYAGGCRDAITPSTGPATPGFVFGENQSAPDHGNGECGYSVLNDTPGTDLALGAYTAQFDQDLTNAGVAHRYCYGDGTHNYTSWFGDLADWLNYVYGTTQNCVDA